MDMKNATDAAKEVVRLATTHGLAKDVIDLMEKKLVLLTGEVEDLTAKATRLEVENGQLRAQLQGPQQKPKLETNAIKVLKHVFDRAGGNVPVAEISHLLQRKEKEAKYFCDLLVDKGFIEYHLSPGTLSRMGPPAVSGYRITTQGRKYFMENLLEA